MGEQNPLMVNETDIHEFRKQIDVLIGATQYMIDSKPKKGGCEVALVKTKLQEAKHWLGEALEVIS